MTELRGSPVAGLISYPPLALKSLIWRLFSLIRQSSSTFLGAREARFLVTKFPPDYNDDYHDDEEEQEGEDSDHDDDDNKDCTCAENSFALC